jgi:HD-like signal output (HDOD) protein
MTMLKRLWSGLTHRGSDNPAQAKPGLSTVPVAPVADAPPNARPAAASRNTKPVENISAAKQSAQPEQEPVCARFEQPEGGIVVDLEIAPGDGMMDTRASVELLASFHNDLEHDRFRLSSLPDTALRIRQLLNDPDLQVSKLADVIGLDPAIAAKLLRVSNSALYASTSRSETIQSAVLRLGLDMTRQIVMAFALKDLLEQCPATLKGLIDEHWEHCIRTSAIAYVLAKRTHLCSPEEALLAGILSNVGVFSVFNYLGNYPDICSDPETIQASIDGLKAEVGAMVLEKWEFSSELVDCARHCEDWSREREDDETDPDVCDLVNVAALHAYIGRRRLPPFDKVPSFIRISGGNLTAEKAVEFMSDAEEDIQQAMTLFYGA